MFNWNIPLVGRFKGPEEDVGSSRIHRGFYPRGPSLHSDLESSCNRQAQFQGSSHLEVAAPVNKIHEEKYFKISKFYKFFGIHEDVFSNKVKKTYESNSFTGFHQCPELTTRTSESTHFLLISSSLSNFRAD